MEAAAVIARLHVTGHVTGNMIIANNISFVNYQFLELTAYSPDAAEGAFQVEKREG